MSLFKNIVVIFSLLVMINSSSVAIGADENATDRARDAANKFGSWIATIWNDEVAPVIVTIWNDKVWPVVTDWTLGELYLDTATGFDEWTPLIDAAWNGQLDIVKELIAAGVDVDARDRNGRTALMYAVWNNQLEVVRELIVAGADAGARDDREVTVLMYAAQNIGRAALMPIWDDLLEIVKELIAAGAEVDDRDYNGRTALICATEGDIEKEEELYGNGRRLELIRVLIASGADVNAKTRNGMTALMNVVQKGGGLELVRVLIAAGADVRARNGDGWTILGLSRWEGTMRVVRELRKAGAM